MTICTRACALLALASCLGCTYYEVHGSCADRPVDVCIGDCRTDRGDGGAPLSCVLDGDCEAGERCEDGWCVPSARCTADLECSPTEICDFRGTCAAPGGCRGDADCASAHLCVEGRCRAFDDVCRFDHDCGPARTCVNGACRSLCEADADCGIGEACADARCRPTSECGTSEDCAPGEHCAGARCLPECARDGDCGPNALCEGGLCRPDVAPRPFCATDADCVEGHLCLNGVCRTPCPSGADEECQRSDIHLVRCGPSASGLLLCYTRNEANPECRGASECASGLCIDAICH